MGLPWWLTGKESANAGNAGSIPGSGRSLEGGNGNLLQYSCMKIPQKEGPVTDSHKESDTTEHTHTEYSGSGITDKTQTYIGKVLSKSFTSLAGFLIIWSYGFRP